MSEHDEQKALFELSERMIIQGRIPELAGMFAVPNGMWSKNKAIAMKQKAEGLKAGVPDIFLPVPKNEYSGMFIEMKYGDGRVRKEQQTWIDQLQKSGYKVEICWTWISAVVGILCYLGYPKSEFPEFFE